MTTTTCLDPESVTLIVIDEIDAYPGPGSYLSTQPKKPYECFGVNVEAFNHCHAEYLACKQLVRATSGDEAWATCAVCHHRIRFCVLCRDEQTGSHYILGRDCAGTIDSGLPTDAWDTKRKMRDVAKIETKRGTRFVHKREVPQWFWDLPRDQRPEFVSVSKWERPAERSSRGGNKVTWFLTVWGESVDEVLTNIEKLEQRVKK